MRILGLDASLTTGYADLEVHRGKPWIIHSTGVITAPVRHNMERFLRYSQIATKMLDIVENQIYDGIFIEGYSFNSKFNGITMGEIGAILRYFLWQNDATQLIVEVPPTSLKAFVTGSGIAKKEAMMLEVYKRWAFNAKNNDEADAYGLAVFGMAWLGMDVGLPAKNMAAVKKVQDELNSLKGKKVKK